MLDIALMLHAEHGGGNNSTFTTHVVSSSGTDTFSSMAASIGSLKGPRHGGANLKVQRMFDDIKANVSDWTNEEEVADYLKRILNKEVFDHAGLIYGMGHAVYTLSDPREVVLKKLPESWRKKKRGRRSLPYTNWWSVLPGSLLWSRGRSLRMSAPMWTSTAALCTRCLVSLRSSLHRSLRSRVFRDGAHTAWRS